MKTHESEEMYLETILRLMDKKGSIRSMDIVDELEYAKSSVSRAVNLLKKRGLIEIDDIGIINFTPEGRQKAAEIYDRHRILTEFLVELGADEELAEADACRIEHVISQEMFDIIKSKRK